MKQYATGRYFIDHNLHKAPACSIRHVSITRQNTDGAIKRFQTNVADCLENGTEIGP